MPTVLATVRYRSTGKSRFQIRPLRQALVLTVDLFLSSQALINLIQERGPQFTFDEYNHMLTLQCKIDVRADTRASNRLSLLPGQQNGMTSGQKTFDSDRTAYNDALIELHSFFM